MEFAILKNRDFKKNLKYKEITIDGNTEKIFTGNLYLCLF